MRRRASRSRLGPVLLVVGAVACSSNPGADTTPELEPAMVADTTVEAETPPVVSVDSAEAHEQRALYESALLRADPQADTYDPNQARADLATLLGLYPDSEYAESARLLSHLLIEVRRLGLSTVRLADRVQELEEKLEGVRQIDLEGSSP
ncbi:MAG: hypothetical protein ABFS14_05910 [Gemmatimonadota bacterium]